MPFMGPGGDSEIQCLGRARANCHLSMNKCSISSICNLMTFYETVPLRPGIMELLIAVAEERHGELEKQLADNYASAGEYLLRLVRDRKSEAPGPRTSR